MCWVNQSQTSEHCTTRKGTGTLENPLFFPPLGGSVPQKVSANSLVSCQAAFPSLSMSLLPPVRLLSTITCAGLKEGKEKAATCSPAGYLKLVPKEILAGNKEVTIPPPQKKFTITESQKLLTHDSYNSIFYRAK